MNDPLPNGEPTRSREPSVGVAIVGHGSTASELLAAARAIVPGHLDDVFALDAGEGDTPAFAERLCSAINRADQGRGVLLLVDLLGASPCQCARKEGAGHDFAVVSGLNLAMLLKVAILDRTSLSLSEIAAACADSGTRSIEVSENLVDGSNLRREGES
jgi:PTS system mannose-specific IIA component